MMIYRRLLSAVVVCVALFAASGTANAEKVFQFTVPFSSDPFDPFNECTGEYIHIEGDVHFIQTEVVKDDGTIQFKQNGNARGWGIGLDSGATYRYAENFQFTQIFTIGTAFSQSADIHTRLIGLGKTPNQRMVYTFNFDVDEDGNVTTSFSEITICQGD